MADERGVSFVNDTVGKLLRDRRFRVPAHQRSYKWEREEHVKTLFQDVQGAMDDPEADGYFLGMLVLKTGETPSDRLEVIDGQQRLATVSIFMAAVRDYFRANDDPKRADDVQRKYLSDTNTRSLEEESHLCLNTEDLDFFQSHIIEEKPIQLPRRSDNPPLSHRRLTDAVAEAKAWVEAIVKLGSPETAGERLLNWVDFFVLHARVVAIYVPEEQNAYTLFETLNDRGLELTKADLIKNHLFGKAGQRLDQVRHLWTEMSALLDAAGGEESTVDFIRHYWLSRYEFVRTKALYNRVKLRTGVQRLAYERATELRDDARLYAALFNPESEVWDEAGETTREHVRTLMHVGVTVLRPLAMSITRRMETKELRRAFHLFVNWSVRFLITGGHRTEATESPFSKTAVEIDKGAITTAAQLAKELGHLIPDDDAFRSAFATATSSKAIIARYYLRAIEDHRAASPHPEWVTHKNAEKVNLEHVLPVNPSREWGIDADSAELLHRRLGNLALLPSAVNVKLGNKPFAAKKAAFTDCSFYYTSWIAAQAEWTEAQIDQRQKLLADEAVKTWPLKVW